MSHYLLHITSCLSPLTNYILRSAFYLLFMITCYLVHITYLTCYLWLVPYLFIINHSLLATSYLLLFIDYSIRIPFYLLPYYLWHSAHFSALAFLTYYLLYITSYWLRITSWLLHITHYLVLIISFLVLLPSCFSFVPYYLFLTNTTHDLLLIG